MKKTIILFLMAGLAGLLQVRAESQLVLLMRNGQTHSYVLSQQPKMTFGSNTLTMTSAEAEATFELTDIENFHFADTENGIRDVKNDDQRFAFVNGILTVEGHHNQVNLTDLAGRQIHASSQGETFRFDLNNQPQGTYLLRIGQQSVKLYHK